MREERQVRREVEWPKLRYFSLLSNLPSEITGLFPFRFCPKIKKNLNDFIRRINIFSPTVGQKQLFTFKSKNHIFFKSEI